MNCRNTPYAKFLGFQEDPRIGGYRAYYVIYAEGFERDLSTVFAGTLRELGIPVPVTPEYVDAKKTDRWLHKCNTCQITYMDVKPCVNHKKLHPEHILVSVQVPVLDAETFEQPDSLVYTKDEVTGCLVESKELEKLREQRRIEASKPAPIEERTQPLDMIEEIETVEPVKVDSDFVKKMKSQYSFLK